MSEVTTIQPRKETREELREFGMKGETYDDVIRKLMEDARKNAFFDDIYRILEKEEFVPIDDL